MSSCRIGWIWIFALLCFVVNGQQPASPLSARYKGGDYELLHYLDTHTRYPASAIRKSMIGISVASITVAPNGKVVSVTIVSPVSKGIDKEVLRVLKEVSDDFIPSTTVNTNQTFYFQFVFNLDIQGKSVELHPVDVDDSNFCRPILVTLHISRNLSVPPTTQFLNSEVNLYIEQKKYKESLPIVEALIHRNPFNIDAYKLQLFLFKQLNMFKEAEGVIEKVNQFIPGKSLEELMR